MQREVQTLQLEIGKAFLYDLSEYIVLSLLDVLTIIVLCGYKEQLEADIGTNQNDILSLEALISQFKNDEKKMKEELNKIKVINLLGTYQLYIFYAIL